MYMINQILGKVRETFTPSQREFEDLVNGAVELDACLINSHEPWNDLSLLNKTRLSSQLMNATEDVLFHLTMFVNLKNYSKIFTPIEQFTAIAETFDKENSEHGEPQVFPPDTDPSRESCIKLPGGWTKLVNETKIEVAVLSVSPECVAKVMNGIGVYEVNGEKNKRLNGRLISLSVTSQDPMTPFKLNSVRSKSLRFPGKGVEIGFHHLVDAWGDQAYEVHRKLHSGEKPKVAIGGAKCVFWNTKN